MIFQLKTIEMENLNTLKEATSFTHEMKKKTIQKKQNQKIFGLVFETLE